MCGICGVVRFDQRPVERDVLARMNDSLAHRGPDDRGMHLQGPVGLGHNRLSILDTSSAGHQPMRNEEGTVWISYNGEVYNHAALREELEGHGHTFVSKTDTEVVLHAYEQWGAACLQRFNGMFSISIWDSAESSLLLARDRIGIKPLFYARLPDRVVFGSEIKAILEDPAVPRDLDRSAMACYFAANWTPCPQTLFRAVRQVEPGQCIRVGLDGSFDCRTYWELLPGEPRPRCRAEALEEFQALLSDSVALRLTSDVPFGGFLSGGVDSSAILYWMRQHLASPPKAFTIGFTESSFDETGFARIVADHVGTEHITETVQADAASILSDLVWHAEEPTADSSMIPMYYLARMARRDVAMVLCGDGADEILAGYETYAASLLSGRFSRLPAWLRDGLIGGAVRRLPVSDAKLSLEMKLKRFVAGASSSMGRSHGAWRIICDANLRERLFAPVWNDPAVRTDLLDLYEQRYTNCPFSTPLERLLWLDTRFYLPNDMLIKVDRMTMAHGLEARVPFLDHRLVEFCFSVPARWKLHPRRGRKDLLRSSLAGAIPRRILNRKKAGFNIPVSTWLRGPLRELAYDTLRPEAIRQTGVLHPPTVEDMLRRHEQKEMDFGHQIWSLLVFMLWWKRFQCVAVSSS